MHFQWIRLSVKQNIKSITFWMLLASMVSLLMMFRFMMLSRIDSGRVLVCTNGSARAEKVIDDMEMMKYHGFTFERADDPEEMKLAILRSEALAGVEFTSENGQVILYSSPDTAVNVVLREYLFPAILKEESSQILSKYVENTGKTSSDPAYKVVMDAQRKYTDNWRIDLLDVNEVDTKESGVHHTNTYNTFAFGLLIMIVFVLTLIEQKRMYTGLWRGITNIKRICFIAEGAVIRSVLLVLFTVMINAVFGLAMFS